MSSKYNKGYKFILCILMFLIFYSCKKDETDLEKFLSKMDKALLSNERSVLIECKDIECYEKFILTNKNSKLKQVFKEIPQSLLDTLNSAGVGDNRLIFLNMCYNLKENNKSISFQDILENINIYHKKKEMASDQRALDKIKRLTKLAETNFKKIHIKDTIRLIFPLENNKNGYNALYRIPFENEKLCTLTCQVLKKEFLPKENQYRFANDLFILKMKIVKLNPSLLRFGLEDIKEGDDFVLNIYEYGREIN